MPLVKTQGSWIPGQSGNPAGRQPESRTLTKIIAACGERDVVLDGITMSGRQALGQLIWQGLIERRVTFPDGQTERLAMKEWIDLLKFLLNQVDGPPRAELDISVKAHAQKIADQYGLDVADVLKEAQSILSEPSVPMQGT